MDYLDCPSPKLWEQRRLWFESIEEATRGNGNYFVSEQACALSAEVQAVFCTGAWGAVLILTMSVVDAALRETEVPGFRGNTKDLLDAAGANTELQKLRQRRNSLVHVDPEQPGITVDEQ